jgi:hypothetical protein
LVDCQHLFAGEQEGCGSNHLACRKNTVCEERKLEEKNKEMRSSQQCKDKTKRKRIVGA